MKFVNLLLVTLLMASCTFGAKNGSEKNVNGMSFLPLKLDNNLEALVVHDPRFKKSSAAMAVMVGSLEDPENALGMAHYLEHMLFLGTKDFPKPEEYSTYMETHGGWDNAYTSDEITNYMFEVDHGAVEGALQRFSRFFVNPLFTAEFLDREKNAVNNEFEKNIKQDNWRLDRFINTLAVPEHPYRKFSTGNTQTLKAVTRDDVISFYKKYYSANNMKLVVMSARPIKETKAWVEKYFKDIPNLKVARPSYKDNYLDLKREKRLHFVKSINDVEEMMVLFNIEDDKEYWASKPMSVIGRLVGDEGKGSLLSLLKEKGWVLSLSAENLWRSFAIHVELTKQGRKEYQEVLKYIFTYLEFIKAKGYPEYLFKDEKNLRQIDLDNLEPSSSGNRAAWFASSMTNYPVTDFLERNFLLSEYSPKDFKRFVDYLTPEKAHVIVASQSEKVKDREDIFGVEYSSAVIPPEVLSAKMDMKTFIYPEQNKYIPNDFSLVKSVRKIHKPEMSTLPDDRGSIAIQTDTELGIAKSTLRLYVISSIEHNVRNKVLMDLYVQGKREEQREWSYPISEARADFGISSIKGDELAIDIAGYSQRLMTIFNDGLQNPSTNHAVHKLGISEKIFEDIKDRYKRDLLNIDEVVAYSRLSLEAGSIADSKGINWREYVKVVDSIKLADVQNFIAQFFATIHVKGFAYGNIEKESVDKCIQKLYEVTQAKPLSATAALQKDSMFRVVPVGKKYSVVVSGRNNNHAHLAFYRLANWTIDTHARGLLLDQMLSQPFFTELRTKQQLGYVARSGVATHSGYVGLTSMIQSSQTGSKELQEKAHAFLSAFLKEKSQSLTDDEIKPFKESIINELLLVPNTLNERAGQFFVAADKYNGRFTIRNDIADAIKKVSAKDLKEFISNTFFAENTGQLVFYYSGKGSKLKGQKLPGETYDDAHKIKSWDVLNPYR